MTEVGRAYYEHCKGMLEEAQAAQDVIDAARAEPRGLLRISCPIGILHAHLGDLVADIGAKGLGDGGQQCRAGLPFGAAGCPAHVDCHRASQRNGAGGLIIVRLTGNWPRWRSGRK